jgi:O-antigen/teichoic acid export membrane protein
MIRRSEIWPDALGMPIRLVKQALGWRPGRLARNSSSLLAWMLLRAAAQAATILLLARTLGASAYGQFVTVVAVASFLSPFIGLGLSNMVLRNGAKDPAHMPVYLRRAARWWLLTLVPGIVVGNLIAVLLLPAGLPHLAVFAAIGADLAATSLTELRARHRQAEHRINAYGVINAALPLVRLVALGVLFAVAGSASTEAVLWVYAVSGLGFVLLLCIPMQWSGSDDEAPEPMSVISGLPFSMATFAMRLQSEFNKPVLAHLGFDLAGAYNVAQRTNDIVGMPLSALQESLWPRLYAHSDPMRQLRRTGSLLLLLATACGVFIWLAAPFLPFILGSDFGKAATVMRSLAWLPLLQSFRSLANFHAIYHGRMKLIGWAYAIGALISVIAVAILVPRFGMSGAALSAYLTEAGIVATLTLLTLVRPRHT